MDDDGRYSRDTKKRPYLSIYSLRVLFKAAASWIGDDVKMNE